MVSPIGDPLGGLRSGFGFVQQAQRAPLLQRQDQLSLLQQQAQLQRAPLEQEILRQRVDAGQQAAQRTATQRDQEQVLAGARIAGAARKLPQAERRPFLESMSPFVGQFEEGDDSDETLDQMILAGQVLGTGGPQTSEQRTFENLIADFTPEEKAQARRIKAGLAPRAVGSAGQTIAQRGIAEEVGESEAVIAGLKSAAQETSKLKAQFQLKPQVESAVREAVATVTSNAKIAEEARSNATALNSYNAAMGGLVSALSETATGPFIGLVPGVTANQQIADGAVAAMAPILKQIFRTAGEGTFTDKDQELLLAMVPTRKDRPEARQSKIQNIDAIVRSKLGSAEEQVQQEVSQNQTTSVLMEGQTATNPSTGEKIIFRNGQWQPL